MQHRQLPDGWDKNLPVFAADAKGIATRESSGKVLNALAQNIPWMVGGSADLAKSNKTNLTFEGAGEFFPVHFEGRNVHFGVREHAMGAAVERNVSERPAILLRHFLSISAIICAPA